MRQWLNNNWPTLALIVVSFFAGHLLLQPKQLEPGIRLIPHIVTKHDTLKVVPRWLSDSIKVWRARKATTDTFSLVTRATFIDTVYVEDTFKMWPMLELIGPSSSKQKEAIVRTFNDHWQVVSSVYAPGPIVGAVTDTLPLPHIQFGSWPQYKIPTLLKVLWAGAGFGVCKASEVRIH